MVYPGFKGKKTPAGNCIPCCYAKPRYDDPDYKMCMGEDVDTKQTQDVFYLIDYRESRILAFNRFGLLPATVSKLFQCQCPPGLMRRDMGCYVVKGILDCPQGKSFLGAVADIISVDKEKPLTTQQLVKELLKKLTPELFKTLSNGVLEPVFNDPDYEFNNPRDKLNAYNNFRKYLQSSSKLDEKYLWDLVSRPDVLTDDGFNLVIITRDSLICPVGEYVEHFYDLKRPWAFLFYNNDYYEPIYHLKNVEHKLVKRWWFYPDNPSAPAPEIKRIYDILLENCPHKNLSIQSILRENEKEYGIKYDMDVKHELNLDDTLAKLDDDKDIVQIIDKYNHVSGILYDGVYIPVAPSGRKIKYPSVDKFNLLSYENTVNKLSEIAKKTGLPVKPVAKILDSKGTKVVAIKTEAERIVPVVSKLLSSVRDGLTVSKWSFYDDADEQIYDRTYYDDDRKLMIAKHKYEEESYQRIRFEISKYIQHHPGIARQVLEIVAPAVEDEDILDTVEPEQISEQNLQTQELMHEKEPEPEQQTPADQEGNQVLDQVGDQDGDGNHDKNKNEAQEGGNKKKTATKAKAKTSKKPKQTNLTTEQKRDKIMEILDELFSKLVTTRGRTINLSDYELPNVRRSCALTGSDDPHCTDNKKVYVHPRNLLTGKDNLSTYKSRLADEIVRNAKLREDILYDNVPYIIDRTRVEPPKKGTVIHGDAILREVGMLFQSSENVYISPFKPFDRKVPNDLSKLYGDENPDLNIEPLQRTWIDLLSPDYVVHINSCGQQSLFCALAEIANYASAIAQYQLDQRAVSYTEHDIRKIMSESIKDLGLKFVTQLAAKLGYEIPAEIEKDTNLIVMYLFNRVKRKNYKEFKSLQDYITSDDYPSDFIDAYIMSYHMKLNLCILEKYPTDRDITVIDNEVSIYALLYVEEVKREYVFSVVKNDGQSLFDFVDLPNNFKNKLRLDETSGQTAATETQTPSKQIKAQEKKSSKKSGKSGKSKK